MHKIKYFFFTARAQSTGFNAISAHIVPSLKCFLSGDTSLSFEYNSIIFQHVQKFIVDTKRF